jgi:hypothetical protein
MMKMHTLSTNLKDPPFLKEKGEVRTLPHSRPLSSLAEGHRMRGASWL